MLKQKLLSSAIEIVDEKDYSQLNEEVKNAEKPKQAIYFIKNMKNFSNEKIDVVRKQGELLEKFKENDEVFRHLGLSRSNI